MSKERILWINIIIIYCVIDYIIELFIGWECNLVIYCMDK